MLSRRTSCRIMLRTADRLEHADAQVRKAVRGSPQVVGDETGWRVDERRAWQSTTGLLRRLINNASRTCFGDVTR